jgi:hypothetical protein
MLLAAEPTLNVLQRNFVLIPGMKIWMNENKRPDI